MALITSAPNTITGVLTQIFLSPAFGDEETPRVNWVINFELPTVKAIYTDEESQIADLSTIKPYGVFFKPYENNSEEIELKCSFMGATYTAEDPDGTIGEEITFTKDV